MRSAFALAALAVAGTACNQHAQPATGEAAGSALVMLRYLPPERGGPSAYPEAQVSGVLDLSGPCVQLSGHEGEMRIVISSPGPQVGRDSAGLYVRSGQERLRHGSSVTGGGGWFSNVPQLGALERPIPEECRSGPFVVVTGMERFDPASEPLPVSPPPPVQP